MAHYCECRRRIVLRSRARRARPGWIYRPGHDLCDRCWRALVARHAIQRLVPARERPMSHGFEPTGGIRPPVQRWQ